MVTVDLGLGVFGIPPEKLPRLVPELEPQRSTEVISKIHEGLKASGSTSDEIAFTVVAKDFNPLVLHRSRIPLSVLHHTLKSLRAAELNYGRLREHNNEASRCGYLNGLWSPIMWRMRLRLPLECTS